MSEQKTSGGKFGRVAYGTAFAFIIAGTTLFQLVLRDYVPFQSFDGGWFDHNRSIAAGLVGGLSGLIGGAIGYAIERLLRR
jgi:hypothetical protein